MTDQQNYDLYGDLDEFGLEQKLKEQHEEYNKLEKKYISALKTIENLQNEIKDLKSSIDIINKNFSSLLLTARAEIKRKDNQLAELRREKDDLCFRRFNRQQQYQNNQNQKIVTLPSSNESGNIKSLKSQYENPLENNHKKLKTNPSSSNDRTEFHLNTFDKHQLSSVSNQHYHQHYHKERHEEKSENSQRYYTDEKGNAYKRRISIDRRRKSVHEMETVKSSEQLYQNRSSYNEKRKDDDINRNDKGGMKRKNENNTNDEHEKNSKRIRRDIDVTEERNGVKSLRIKVSDENDKRSYHSEKSKEKVISKTKKDEDKIKTIENSMNDENGKTKKYISYTDYVKSKEKRRKDDEQEKIHTGIRHEDGKHKNENKKEIPIENSKNLKSKKTDNTKLNTINKNLLPNKSRNIDIELDILKDIDLLKQNCENNKHNVENESVPIQSKAVKMNDSERCTKSICEALEDALLNDNFQRISDKDDSMTEKNNIDDKKFDKLMITDDDIYSDLPETLILAEESCDDIISKTILEQQSENREEITKDVTELKEKSVEKEDDILTDIDNKDIIEQIRSSNMNSNTKESEKDVGLYSVINACTISESSEKSDRNTMNSKVSTEMNQTINNKEQKSKKQIEQIESTNEEKEKTESTLSTLSSAVVLIEKLMLNENRQKHEEEMIRSISQREFPLKDIEQNQSTFSIDDQNEKDKLERMSDRLIKDKEYRSATMQEKINEISEISVDNLIKKIEDALEDSSEKCDVDILKVESIVNDSTENTLDNQIQSSEMNQIEEKIPISMEVGGTSAKFTVQTNNYEIENIKNIVTVEKTLKDSLDKDLPVQNEKATENLSVVPEENKISAEVVQMLEVLKEENNDTEQEKHIETENIPNESENSRTKDDKDVSKVVESELSNQISQHTSKTPKKIEFFGNKSQSIIEPSVGNSLEKSSKGESKKKRTYLTPKKLLLPSKSSASTSTSTVNIRCPKMIGHRIEGFEPGGPGQKILEASKLKNALFEENLNSVASNNDQKSENSCTDDRSEKENEQIKIKEENEKEDEIEAIPTEPEKVNNENCNTVVKHNENNTKKILSKNCANKRKRTTTKSGNMNETKRKRGRPKKVSTPVKKNDDNERKFLLNREEILKRNMYKEMDPIEETIQAVNSILPHINGNYAMNYCDAVQDENEIGNDSNFVQELSDLPTVAAADINDKEEKEFVNHESHQIDSEIIETKNNDNNTAHMIENKTEVIKENEVDVEKTLDKNDEQIEKLKCENTIELNSNQNMINDRMLSLNNSSDSDKMKEQDISKISSIPSSLLLPTPSSQISLPSSSSTSLKLMNYDKNSKNTINNEQIEKIIKNCHNDDELYDKIFQSPINENNHNNSSSLNLSIVSNNSATKDDHEYNNIEKNIEELFENSSTETVINLCNKKNEINEKDENKIKINNDTDKNNANDAENECNMNRNENNLNEENQMINNDDKKKINEDKKENNNENNENNSEIISKENTVEDYKMDTKKSKKLNDNEVHNMNICKNNQYLQNLNNEKNNLIKNIDDQKNNEKIENINDQMKSNDENNHNHNNNSNNDNNLKTTTIINDKNNSITTINSSSFSLDNSYSKNERKYFSNSFSEYVIETGDNYEINVFITRKKRKIKKKIALK